MPKSLPKIKMKNVNAVASLRCIPDFYSSTFGLIKFSCRIYMEACMLEVHPVSN